MTIEAPWRAAPDARPGRIGAEHLRDVICPAARLVGTGVAPGPVRVGETADRTDDHDDLGVRQRGSSDLHRFGHDHAGGDQRDGQVDGASSPARSCLAVRVSLTASGDLQMGRRLASEPRITCRP